MDRPRVGLERFLEGADAELRRVGGADRHREAGRGHTDDRRCREGRPALGFGGSGRRGVARSTRRVHALILVAMVVIRNLLCFVFRRLKI